MLPRVPNSLRSGHSPWFGRKGEADVAKVADLPVAEGDRHTPVAILVVDDVEANRLALRQLLQADDREIIEASSGTEALRILLLREVALILLDIEMQEMDGFETADLIRGSARFQHIPIIFQSAHATDNRVVRGYGLGAVDFIQKPIIPEILQARVEVFLTLERRTSELRRTHEQLTYSESRSRAILETATDGIITVDQNGCIEMFNAAAERMFGYDEEEIAGTLASTIVAIEGSDEPVFGLGASAQIVGSTSEVRGHRRDGSTFPVGISVSRVDAADEHFYSATLRDLTEMKKVEQRLTRLAQSDYLTGLANRITFEDRMQQCLAQSRRSDYRCALLYMDLDGFKGINDGSGHGVGDLLLQEVSHRLEELIRESDVVARLGGDEFCILVDHLSQHESVGLIGERIVSAMREPFVLDGVTLEISASVGIALFRPGQDTVTDVTLRADTAMYKAKRLGGDRLVMSGDGESASMPFAEEVRESVEANNFELDYESIVSISDGSIVCKEALLRWNRPGVGFTLPKTFLRAAEASGTMAVIGQWVIRTALAHAAAMSQRGDNISVSINLSLPELIEPGLTSFVSESVAEAGVDPGRICFEIAGQALMSVSSRVADTVAALQAQGSRIALDEFGLGYSSLSLLTDFPCDIVKLDRSLVVALESPSPRPRTVIRSIVELAHAFDRQVIAIGVETESQFAAISALGCDMAQGLLISTAISAPPSSVESAAVG